MLKSAATKAISSSLRGRPVQRPLSSPLNPLRFSSSQLTSHPRFASQIYVQNAISTRSHQNTSSTQRRFTRWLAILLLPTAALWIFGAVSIEFVDDEEDEEDEEAEYTNVLAFIPYSWPKALPREYYKGSDPEWRIFREFALDQKAQVATQSQLVSHIRTRFASRKDVQRFAGKVDPKRGRVMLSITFPQGPPLEYEMSGLVLLENGAGLAAKLMSQAEYIKWKRTFWPADVFWSSLEYPKFLLQAEWIRLQRAVGAEPKISRRSPLNMIFKDGTTSTQSDPSVKQEHGRPEASPKIGPLPPDDRSSTQSSPEGYPTGIPRATASASKPTLHAEGADAGQQAPTGKHIASMLFARKLALTRYKDSMRLSMHDPPRGCCKISGLMEIVGDKGRITVDVTAHYDIQTGRLVNVYPHFRELKPAVQKPRGGP